MMRITKPFSHDTTPVTDEAPPSKERYLKLAAETEATLLKDVLEVWFPRSLDRANGGFSSDFACDWQPAPSGGKFSVSRGA